MEARIHDEFPEATVELIESSGGVFEVEADGEQVYSKREMGRHPTWEEVRDRLGGHR